MDYFLNEEQTMLRDLARQIAVERMLPIRAELDEKEEFPHSVYVRSGRRDLFGVVVPEEYGGLGFGALENCVVVEELSGSAAA